MRTIETVWQRVQVDADSALASRARATPTLFINGRLHVAGFDEPTLGAALATAIKERMTMAVCTHLDQIKLTEPPGPVAGCQE